jgi:hypothetical protein
VQEEPKLVEVQPGEEPTAPTSSPFPLRHMLRGLLVGLLIYLAVFALVGGLAGVMVWRNPGLMAWNWPTFGAVFVLGALLFAAGGALQALLRDWLP